MQRPWCLGKIFKNIVFLLSPNAKRNMTEMLLFRSTLGSHEVKNESSPCHSEKDTFHIFNEVQITQKSARWPKCNQNAQILLHRGVTNENYFQWSLLIYSAPKFWCNLPVVTVKICIAHCVTMRRNFGAIFSFWLRRFVVTVTYRNYSICLGGSSQTSLRPLQFSSHEITGAWKMRLNFVCWRYKQKYIHAPSSSRLSKKVRQNYSNKIKLLKILNIEKWRFNLIISITTIL